MAITHILVQAQGTGAPPSGRNTVSGTYIKFTVTAQYAATTYIEVPEFYMYDSANTEFATTSIAQTTGAYVNPHFASNIIDRDDTTRWLDTFHSGDYVTFEFASPVTLDSYAWMTPTADLNRSPSGWTIEVSSDNSNWTLLDTRTGYVRPGTIKTQTEQFYIAPATGPA